MLRVLLAVLLAVQQEQGSEVDSATMSRAIVALMEPTIVFQGNKVKCS